MTMRIQHHRPLLQPDSMMKSTGTSCRIALLVFFLCGSCLLFSVVELGQIQKSMKTSSSQWQQIAAASPSSSGSSSNNNNNNNNSHDNNPLAHISIDKTINSEVASPQILNDKYIVSRDQFSLLYGIFVRAQDYHLRHIIRLNHLYEMPARYNIDVYFILGQDPTGDYNDFIDLENKTYGDLIVLPNTPENMNEGKTYSYFSHIASTYSSSSSSWTLIGKFDSDTYTHFDSLYKFLLLSQIRSQIRSIVLQQEQNKTGNDRDGNTNTSLLDNIRWEECDDFYYWWNLGIESPTFGDGDVGWLNKGRDVYFGSPTNGLRDFYSNNIWDWTSVYNYTVNRDITTLIRKGRINSTKDDNNANTTSLIEEVKWNHNPKNPKSPNPFYMTGSGYGMSMDVAEWLNSNKSYAYHHRKIRGEDSTTTRWLYVDSVGNNLWGYQTYHTGLEHNLCYDSASGREKKGVPGYCTGPSREWWKHNRTIQVHPVKTLDRWVNVSRIFYPKFDFNRYALLQ